MGLNLFRIADTFLTDGIFFKIVDWRSEELCILCMRDQELQPWLKRGIISKKMRPKQLYETLSEKMAFSNKSISLFFRPFPGKRGTGDFPLDRDLFLLPNSSQCDHFPRQQLAFIKPSTDIWYTTWNIPRGNISVTIKINPLSLGWSWAESVEDQYAAGCSSLCFVLHPRTQEERWHMGVGPSLGRSEWIAPEKNLPSHIIIQNNTVCNMCWM